MVNFNGSLEINTKAILNAENRAFKYGDALFETLKVEHLKIYFMEDHYFRLMASMRMLRMEIPMNFTMEFLENEILKTLKANRLERARVRVTIFRKDGGLYTPTNNEIDYLIEVASLNDKKKNTYSIEVFKDYFIYSGLLSSVKTTNKIINVLAGIYAAENGFDNCILLNERKHIAEAINGNIFLVQGNIIKTPAINEGCVKGILRKKIIEIVSKSENYSLVETEISLFELQRSNEVFITNVIVGIQPVTSYKKMKFNIEVSEKLALALQALI